MAVATEVSSAPRFAGSQAKDLGKAQRDALMKGLLDTPPELRCADPVREAALAEALTAFVKNTPERVKRVVRLIKASAAVTAVCSRPRVCVRVHKGENK